MMEANSVKLITPSPSVSASLIISVSSRYVRGCPILAMAPANSAAVMKPLPSRSKYLNTPRSCSWFTKTCSFMSAKMALTNSSNSTFPLPFESMLANSAWTWSPEGFSPSALRSAASSNIVKLPSESMSNLPNISLSWFTWCT